MSHTILPCFFVFFVCAEFALNLSHLHLHADVMEMGFPIFLLMLVFSQSPFYVLIVC